MFKKPKDSTTAPVQSPGTPDQLLGWGDLFPIGYFEAEMPEDKTPSVQPMDRGASLKNQAFSQQPPLLPMGHLLQIDESLGQTANPAYENTPEFSLSDQPTATTASRQRPMNPPPLLFTPPPVVTTNISVNFPVSMAPSTLTTTQEDTGAKESKTAQSKTKPSKVRRKSKRLKRPHKKRKRVTRPSSSSDEQRPLSKAEAKRIRNRNAAKDYRDRRKKYIQSLESQVKELQTQLDAAHKKARGLEIANAMLQNQVEELSQTTSSSAHRKRYQF